MEKPVKVTSHCRPTIKRLHNIRDPKIVKSEKHIDESRHHETILDMGTMEECYEKIFGKTVKKYNAKQKRNDRKIEICIVRTNRNFKEVINSYDSRVVKLLEN